ncbi:hypothetical protein [Vibrio sp. 1CM23M]|uniref:hypothetical protein n=1 Tax=Vibrio sp. 1CM23M TaxID=2929164 RepID=UPI0020BDF245|nr:hypothetical protein [Vibrio sp. 1CM23M]MCK8072416.1 hypothetical protein [Vibrio sp. 1CM23M]
MNKTIIKSNLLLVTTMFVSVSMAKDVASLTSAWWMSIFNFGEIIVILSTIIGLGMMVSGGIQLKKHGENPQQVPLNRSLIFLAAGSMLFGLGATSNTIQDTIFGVGEGKQSDANMEEDYILNMI